MLTVEKVSEIVASANLDMPAGSVRMGRIDYQLRVEGQFKNSEEIRNLVVGNVEGRNIFIRDIADVKDTIKDIMIAERSNGGKGMRMMIMKQSGANTVAVAKAINAKMAELEKTLPKDVKVLQVYDSSTFIESSIGNLSETLLFALIFVALVILFFLGRWRATFIILITIPISLIVAFAYLYLTGSSINIISLSSLSIAIGMVVDDAIVVLENIERHIEQGDSPVQAAIKGIQEVGLTLVAMNLALVVIFISVLFM
ncbi:MAG: efflux RND transporter permease subunit, partial [Bacteroidales bacterium]